MPPVEHISQLMAREVQAGDIKLNALEKRQAFTPITTRATWDGTTMFTTSRARCWTRFPD